jgi:hypothetical protein
MEATHFCTQCLEETNKDVKEDTHDPKLVFKSSNCDSTEGKKGPHNWTLIIKTTTGVCDSIVLCDVVRIDYITSVYLIY